MRAVVGCPGHAFHIGRSGSSQLLGAAFGRRACRRDLLAQPSWQRYRPLLCIRQPTHAPFAFPACGILCAEEWARRPRDGRASFGDIAPAARIGFEGVALVLVLRGWRWRSRGGAAQVGHQSEARKQPNSFGLQCSPPHHKLRMTAFSPIWHDLASGVVGDKNFKTRDGLGQVGNRMPPVCMQAPSGTNSIARTWH